jgi:hypothetical protein
MPEQFAGILERYAHGIDQVTAGTAVVAAVQDKSQNPTFAFIWLTHYHPRGIPKYVSTSFGISQAAFIALDRLTQVGQDRFSLVVKGCSAQAMHV